MSEAESKTIVIMRHGRPAGVLVGVADDDWFDYRLEHDPRFQTRIAQARESIKSSLGVRLEKLTFENDNSAA